MYNNVFGFFFSVFFFLLACQFLFIFLVASFDGLRPLLVTSHCLPLRSLANKLRSFVHVASNHVATDKLTTANGGAQPVSVANHVKERH